MPFTAKDFADGGSFTAADFEEEQVPKDSAVEIPSPSVSFNDALFGVAQPPSPWEFNPLWTQTGEQVMQSKPLPEFTPFDEKIEPAIRFAETGPFPTPEQMPSTSEVLTVARDLMPFMPSGAEGNPLAIGAASAVSGFSKVLSGFANWALSPSGIAQQAALLHPVTGLPMTAKFLYDMASESGRLAGDLSVKIEELVKNPELIKDPEWRQSLTDDTAALIATGPMTGMLAKHQASIATKRIKAAIDSANPESALKALNQNISDLFKPDIPPKPGTIYRRKIREAPPVIPRGEETVAVPPPPAPPAPPTSPSSISAPVGDQRRNELLSLIDNRQPVPASMVMNGEEILMPDYVLEGDTFVPTKLGELTTERIQAAQKEGDQNAIQIGRTETVPVREAPTDRQAVAQEIRTPEELAREGELPPRPSEATGAPSNAEEIAGEPVAPDEPALVRDITDAQSRVSRIVEQRYGKDHGFDVIFDPNLPAARFSPPEKPWKIELNAAHLKNRGEVISALREELGHEIIATPKGQSALKSFMEGEKTRLNADEVGKLQEQGYLPRGEELTEIDGMQRYMRRLTDEYIAKTNIPEMGWFRQKVDSFVGLVYRATGVLLSKPAAARALLRAVAEQNRRAGEEHGRRTGEPSVREAMPKSAVEEESNAKKELEKYEEWMDKNVQNWRKSTANIPKDVFNEWGRKRMAVERAHSAGKDADFYEPESVLDKGFPVSFKGSNATLVPPETREKVAYHGTPHEVDRFKKERIGTGEGGQVYGWGLYFAENAEVAREYQRKFESEASGVPALGDLHPKFLDRSIDNDVFYEYEQATTIQGAINRMRDIARNEDDYSAKARSQASEILSYLENIPPEKASLYTVDLDVKPGELLDWDRPLTEQADIVSKIPKEVLEKSGMDDALVPQAGYVGKDLYDAVASIQPAELGKFNQQAKKAASEYLNSIGIKGIQYLDQGSRDLKPVNRNGYWTLEDPITGDFKGKWYSKEDAIAEADKYRTRNYVIFDESRIKILEKNGRPVAPRDAVGEKATTEMPETREMLSPEYRKKLDEDIKAGGKFTKMYKAAVDVQKKLESEKAYWKLNPDKTWVNDNMDYWKSVDPDSLCQKSDGTDAAVNYLRTKLGKDYDPSYGWEVIARAQEKGLQTPCPQCYVVSARAAGGFLAKKYVVGVAGYNGEVARWQGSNLDQLARTSLRHYSNTDFKAEHIPGLIAEFVDATKSGLPLAAYSKQADLARVFGPAGMHINMSIGRNEAVGMNLKEALEMRKKYKNVGTVYVSFNDAETISALRKPYVDHVIPWHSSGQPVAELAKKLGEIPKDYTKTQSEFDPKTGKKAVPQIKDYEHGGDLNKYLKLVKERGLIKKFPQIYEALKKTGEEKLYMKLLGPEYGKHGGKYPYEPVDASKIDLGAIDGAMKSRLKSRKASDKDFIDIAKAIEREVKSGKFVRGSVKPEVESGPIKQDTAPTPEPRESLPDDVASYEDNKKRMTELMRAGKIDTPEFRDAFTKNEEIKNRYKGMPPVAPETREVLSGEFKYPIEDRDKWYGDSDYKSRGGVIKSMSPDEFLKRAKPLNVDEGSRDNIDALKRHIESGGKLDPLAIYASDAKNVINTDGRHRAIAARELGIKEVPVIDFTKDGAEFGEVPETREAIKPPETEEFKRWFGNSKVVDENGKPLVMYHGSPKSGITVFEPGDINRLIWTTKSKRYAKGYSETSVGNKGEIYPLYVKAENPFDYSKSPRETANLAMDFFESPKGQMVFRDRQYWMPRLVNDYEYMRKGDKYTKLAEDVTDSEMDSYGSDEFVKHIQSGSWVALEIPEFIDFVKNAGYDGWVSREGNTYNVAVFSPTQIKSAIGNRGTFSPESPDIRESLAKKEKDFDLVALSQRGLPERAMEKIQRSQISQSYGFLAEHIGDLTHRMSQHIASSKGQFETVRDKVRKSLDELKKYPEELDRQIKSNHEFSKTHVDEMEQWKIPVFDSWEQAKSALVDLGKNYAEEHRKIPTFNEVQKLAQNAAIAIGQFDFRSAKLNLQVLDGYLSRGRSEWEKMATEGLDRSEPSPVVEAQKPTNQETPQPINWKKVKNWYLLSKEQLIEARRQILEEKKNDKQPERIQFEKYPKGWYNHHNWKLRSEERNEALTKIRRALETDPEERESLVQDAKDNLKAAWDFLRPQYEKAPPPIVPTSADPIPNPADYNILKEAIARPHGAGRVPFFGRLYDARYKGNDPVKNAFIVDAFSRKVNDTVGVLVGAEFKGADEAFKFDRDTGKITNMAPGNPEYLQDIAKAYYENPSSVTLTADQKMWLDKAKVYVNRVLDIMASEGIPKAVAIRDVFADGTVVNTYFPRTWVGKRNPKATPAKRVGGRVATLPPQFKQRFYKTEQEGAANNIYANFSERMTSYVQRGLNAVSSWRLVHDRELGGMTVRDRYEAMAEGAFPTLEALKQAVNAATTPADAKARYQTYLKEFWRLRAIHRTTFANMAADAGRIKAEEGKVAHPAFQSYIFDAKTAAAINERIAPTRHKAFDVISNINKLSNAFRLSLDWSAPFVQGMPALWYSLASRNNVWGRAFADSAKSWFKPDYMRRMMENPDLAETARELAQMGVSLGRLQDYMAGTQKGDVATRIPILGKAFERSGASFGAFLDLAKIHWWRAVRDTAPRSEWPKLAEGIENLIGSGRSSAAGLHPNVVQAEGIAALAPAYYRAGLNVLANLVAGGKTGKVTIQTIGSMLAGITATAVAGMMSAGLTQEEILKKLKKFDLTFPVQMGGKAINVGFSHITLSLLKTSVQTALYKANDRPLTEGGVEENPILKFLWGHAGAIPSGSLEVALSRDFLGQNTSWGKTLAKLFTPLSAAQAMESIKSTDTPAAVGDALGTAFGLNVYPENYRQEWFRKANAISKSKFGVDYDRLAVPDQAAVKKALSPDPSLKNKPAPTRATMFAAIEAQQKRIQQLTEGVGEGDQKFLSTYGLKIPGFDSTITFQGVKDVYLSKEQQDVLANLIVAEYKVEIAKLMRNEYFKRSSDEARKKIYRSVMDHAKQRAKNKFEKLEKEKAKSYR